MDNNQQNKSNRKSIDERFDNLLDFWSKPIKELGKTKATPNFKGACLLGMVALLTIVLLTWINPQSSTNPLIVALIVIVAFLTRTGK